MKANTKSLVRGFIYVSFLSLAWIVLCVEIFRLTDSMSLIIGIISIVFIVGASGFNTIPIEHKAVPKIFGKRAEEDEKQFSEGPTWLRPGETVEKITVKREITNVPKIFAFSKDNVEMELDLWVRWKIINPNKYLNLENPKQTVDHRIYSICNDAGAEFIQNHTAQQSRTSKSQAQAKIELAIKEQAADCGIALIADGVDIQPIRPIETIRQAWAKDKQREIDVRRHKKSVKQVAGNNPELRKDPKELENIAFIAEGRIKKDVQEKSQRIGIDPETLQIIASVAKSIISKEEKDEK